jgi:hypothetical protein
MNFSIAPGPFVGAAKFDAHEHAVIFLLPELERELASTTRT